MKVAGRTLGLGIMMLFLTALGLSMDAFAVSITNGMTIRDAKAREASAIGLAFGLFQALMPVIGYAAGQVFTEYVQHFDHWIALVLLGFIGGKMVYEGIRECRCPEATPVRKKLGMRMLVVQAVATSIDALAVGVSFAFLNINIISAALFIGVTTFICSFIGVFIGKKCGCMLGVKAEILGGVILVLIGLKIFIEHVLG